jgi:quercetin dioxygenase-like cupin family protein
MIYKNNETNYKTVKKGLLYKILVHEEKTHMIKVLANKGVVLEHAHLHEQTGYLLKRCIKLTIEDILYNILPGDAWAIPGKTWHRVEMLKDCQIL